MCPESLGRSEAGPLSRVLVLLKGNWFTCRLMEIKDPFIFPSFKSPSSTIKSQNILL